MSLLMVYMHTLIEFTLDCCLGLFIKGSAYLVSSQVKIIANEKLIFGKIFLLANLIDSQKGR